MISKRLGKCPHYLSFKRTTPAFLRYIFSRYTLCIHVYTTTLRFFDPVCETKIACTTAGYRIALGTSFSFLEEKGVCAAVEHACCFI